MLLNAFGILLGGLGLLFCSIGSPVGSIGASYRLELALSGFAVLILGLAVIAYEDRQQD